ncbi:hypothetical protein F5X68DRAFT_206473 [Plectosphaerella plurivora]|uniref:Uncharacterized protein n=1 Tax=Plectosphaerella plurivora TaxID=936078 RepID=A0A9P8VBU7_9PEZI|nr:hypothetical protein F5X68DRAFT_206473 [Plectosphaerella plurivora]
MSTSTMALNANVSTIFDSPEAQFDADSRSFELCVVQVDALFDDDRAAHETFHTEVNDQLQRLGQLDEKKKGHQHQLRSLQVELDELHIQMDELRSRIDSKNMQITDHCDQIKACRQEGESLLALMDQRDAARKQQNIACEKAVDEALTKAREFAVAMHRTEAILRASPNKRPREEAPSQQTTGQLPSELPRDTDRPVKRLRIPESLSPGPWNQLPFPRVSTNDNSGPSQSKAITSSPSKTLYAPGSTEKSLGPSQSTAGGPTPGTQPFVPRVMTRNERRQLAKASKLAEADRTIFFEDVFKRGEPRHQIINHPPGSATFWILECAEHRIQFGSDALVMTTQHACGLSHHEINATPSRMVDKFGKLVWCCTAEKAAVNNEMCAELEEKALQRMNRSEARMEQDGSQRDAVVASEQKQNQPGHVRVKSEESEDTIVVSLTM